MINLLSRLDRQSFLFINLLPHHLSLDLFFGFITAIGYLGFIWILIGMLHLIYKKKGSKKILTALFLSDILSLIFVELIIKNILKRLRPQFVIPATILPFDVGRSFSFPSGHATIAFAAAYILAKKDKRGTFFYYLLAFLISFSRIYLGKHYPSDVLVGMLFGLLIGFFSLKIAERKLKQNEDKKY